MNKLTRLQELIGYRFKNPALLSTALTHTSCGPENNQRLEFLGDAVLGLYAAETLYSQNPAMKEGEMTRARAASVCEGALFDAASAFSLGEFLSMSKGEESCGGRNKPSIVSDAFESLTAAIYLDGGFEAAMDFAKRFVPLKKAPLGGVGDFKTRLQELLQKNGATDIRYELIGERGLDHEKVFISRVLHDGKPLGSGEGRSKKESEQQAAKAALSALEG